MFAQSFRFNSTQFRNGALLWGARRAFAPRKPRHPLMRAVLGVVGLGVMVLLVTFSVLVGAAMLAVGLVYRLFRGHARPVAHDRSVVDAQYRVVEKDSLPPR